MGVYYNYVYIGTRNQLQKAVFVRFKTKVKTFLRFSLYVNRILNKTKYVSYE